MLDLEPGRYLTIGVPQTQEIRGVRIAPRDASSMTFSFEQAPALTGTSTRGVWLLQAGAPAAPSTGSDMDLYAQGFIVITPMVANEHDAELADMLEDRIAEFPPW